MRIILLLFIAGLIISCNPSTNKVSIDDYNRAVSFLPDNLSELVYHLDVRPNWLDDSTGFWYETNTAKGNTFYHINTNTFESKELFDHTRLADSLGLIFDDKVDRSKLPVEDILYVNTDSIGLLIKGRHFNLRLTNYDLSELTSEMEEISQDKIISPDGKWEAYFKDYNLFIRSKANGKEIQLSRKGEKGFEYSNYYGWGDVIRGENGERKNNLWVEWSPDSKKILTSITDLRSANKMYLLDWSIDSLYRPDLLYYYRASPGDTDIVYSIPVLFDIQTRKEIRLDIPPQPHFNSMFLQWSENSNNLYGIYRYRGYKKLDFIEFNINNGQKRVVGSDQNNINVDMMYFAFEMSEKYNHAFFTSERSGWNQLYKINWKTGEITAITSGAYFITDISYIDEESQVVYYSAMGKEPDENPYLQKLYSVGFKGENDLLLTPETSFHSVDFSSDGKVFVDNFSRLDQPTKSVIRKSSSGEIVLEISETDITELIKTGWNMPKSFKITGRDDISDIYGALWTPTNFRASENYPIIDHSYTGPHYSIYPKTFSSVIWNSERQSIAELGFVVMVVDGLGSAMRSKEFHNWSYGKLGYNLEGHVSAIRQLSKQYAWIDTTRVGIYGHSAGGYDAAHALLQYPDFYKVAVASSADHDHRMEKAWWPEMYMGWPVDSQYHQQSNITMARNLKGKLLITHGGIDENVNPSATFKLADALIKEDKQFDMLILPSQRHGYRGVHREYFTKRKWNYFVEHLLYTEPIWDFEL